MSTLFGESIGIMFPIKQFDAFYYRLSTYAFGKPENEKKKWRSELKVIRTQQESLDYKFPIYESSFQITSFYLMIRDFNTDRS